MNRIFTIMAYRSLLITLIFINYFRHMRMIKYKHPVRFDWKFDQSSIKFRLYGRH